MERMGRIECQADRSESEEDRAIDDRFQIVIRLNPFRNRCLATRRIFSAIPFSPATFDPPRGKPYFGDDKELSP